MNETTVPYNRPIANTNILPTHQNYSERLEVESTEMTDTDKLTWNCEMEVNLFHALRGHKPVGKYF